MPRDLAGFKRTNVFDGTESGIPYVTNRPPVPPGPERAAIIAYLRQGEPALAARGRALDLLDPSCGKKIPMIHATDSEWIWDVAVAYYLENHHIPPESEFVQYLRSKNFHYTQPPKEKVKGGCANHAARQVKIHS